MRLQKHDLLTFNEKYNVDGITKIDLANVVNKKKWIKNGEKRTELSITFPASIYRMIWIEQFLTYMNFWMGEFEFGLIWFCRH